MRLRSTGLKSSSGPVLGGGATGRNMSATNAIAAGPMPVTMNAGRQPQRSATNCETRNETPTPTEKLAVYKVMLREVSPEPRRSVSAFNPGMYAPANPMPAKPQSRMAEPRPVASTPKSTVASPLKSDPQNRIQRASIRSVRVVSTGTASM